MMTDSARTDADAHPIDQQELKTGKLDDDAKLDIALQGSLMTSEPPQIAEPKTAAHEEADAGARGDGTGA